ncbi:MAG: ZIP family metal transporter [Candidatus Zixiibacteriota bacterium]
MSSQLLTYCLTITAAAFLAGLVACARSWSDRLLHMFISFGAGIFLGAVFFELLPEAMSHENNRAVGVAILVGYLAIFAVEKILMVRGDGGYDYGHKVTSIAAFTGLSVHSIIDGLGLAVGSLDPRLGRIVFFSILAHHVPASFSVSSLLTLGKFGRGKLIWLVLLFSAMPMIGALLFEPMLSSASDPLFAILAGVMTGTFLYVATGDLLPEAFHSRHGRWGNLGVLVVGVLVMALVSFGFEHVHQH